MPLRKIDGDPKYPQYKKICRNPSHNPPMHIVLKPGIYEYSCPACGEIQIISIPDISMRYKYGNL